jgi:hypothetical protein
MKFVFESGKEGIVEGEWTGFVHSNVSIGTEFRSFAKLPGR